MKLNRRKLLSLLGMSPALLAGSSLDAEVTKPGKTAKTPKDSAATAGEPKLVGLNPKATPPPVILIPMAPRLSSLDGKTVYLVDTGFNNGNELLHQIQIWFQKNMPSVKTVFRRKAGPYEQDDPKLWAEIKQNGNAAIMAIGH